MSSFKLDVADLAWIAGAKDDPQDYCLHGRATAIIGSRALTYDCTVSAAALYLLKTLTEDHILGEDNQLFPCCGHFLVANDGLTNVTIIGCDSGVDWSVFHEEQHVRLVLEDGTQELVPLEHYCKEVFRFADPIQAYYRACSPKALPEDAFKRNGYLAFWNEWRRRRADGITPFIPIPHT